MPRSKLPGHEEGPALSGPPYAAKLYVPEADSAAVREHLEGCASEVCLSELARAELLAVFHRRLRVNLWTPAQFSTAARQFQQDDLAGF